MRKQVVEQLRNLNRDFYDRLADPFAHSRARPQPGFYRLLEYLPQPCRDLLDVGCGEGRFGRFLREEQIVVWYTGIDFSAELLVKAAANSEGDFFQRDVSQAGCLPDLGQFDLVVCLAALQHIPGRANRLRLLREMKGCLAQNGRLFLSTWQFMDSQRQQRKVRDWSEMGLSADDVEPNDHLLTWQRGGFGLRYVCLIDEAETAVLAREAGLQTLHQFRSDGKEGNLSLYTVMRRMKDEG